MSCSWHPIATRRWWLDELIPFPSTVLPPDLHAWLCISSLRGPSRRRPPTWNPASAILCALEAYFYLGIPSFLLHRPSGLDSLLLGAAQKIAAPVAGAVGFQIRGCLVNSRLPDTVSPPCWGLMQGVVKPAMAVDRGLDRDPMRAFYPVLGLFRDALMQCRERDGIERDGVWWLLPTSGRVPYAEPCGGSFLGPGRPRTQSPTSTQHPAPTARSRAHNSALAPGIWTDQIPKPSTN